MREKKSSTTPWFDWTQSFIWYFWCHFLLDRLSRTRLSFRCKRIKLRCDLKVQLLVQCDVLLGCIWISFRSCRLFKHSQRSKSQFICWFCWCFFFFSFLSYLCICRMRAFCFFFIRFVRFCCVSILSLHAFVCAKHCFIASNRLHLFSAHNSIAAVKKKWKISPSSNG